MLGVQDLSVHLQLLDLAGAVDVVGYGVAPGMRMRSDEVLLCSRQTRLQHPLYDDDLLNLLRK